MTTYSSDNGLGRCEEALAAGLWGADDRDEFRFPSCLAAPRDQTDELLGAMR